MKLFTALGAARRAFSGTLAAKQAPMVTLAGGGVARLMGDRFKDFAEEGYQLNPIVYRCVNLIAEGAAAIPFKLFRGEEEQAGEHPLLRLLARPTPIRSGVELFTALYGYRLIDGNAFLLRAGPVMGPPRELYVLRPDRIKIQAGTVEIPRAYEYVVDGRTVAVYSVDPQSGQSEVKHLRLWNPLDDHKGQSPLRAAALRIDQHNASGKHNLALLQNDATPRGAFIYSPKDDAGAVASLDEAQLRSIKADLNREFGGPTRSG
ncbi:MAG: phage portal protein, partial [Proteobacteria bacterium]|nr:phage portal protein [Pseudomonadota bacterium]